jgi:uncharacterized protein with FMN-binding domain
MNSSSITKYIIGGVVVVALVAYVVFSNKSSAPAIVTTPAAVVSEATTTGSTTTSGGTTTANPTSTSGTSTGGSASSGEYKDGTYLGSVADAFYGKLQVSVVVSGGKLTDVTFPQYPNDPGHTADVSATALPTLKQEAIAAQSAQVNTVSGATQDSEAFQQSLAVALTAAKS